MLLYQGFAGWGPLVRWRKGNQKPWRKDPELQISVPCRAHIPSKASIKIRHSTDLLPTFWLNISFLTQFYRQKRPPPPPTCTKMWCSFCIFVPLKSSSPPQEGQKTRCFLCETVSKCRKQIGPKAKITLRFFEVIFCFARQFQKNGLK